jgi:hypothetical protein
MSSYQCTTYYETQTIPQRLTVAGEAWLRSFTSNKMRIFALSLILSPFDKQSIIESSRTVFKFSTQMASTGPSNMTY